MLRFALGVGVLAVASITGTAALAQGAPAGGAGPGAQPFVSAVVREVKPGLYMIVGNGGNSTLRVADDGLILVDTKLGNDPAYQDLMQKIQGVSQKPVKDVFVTHVHNDHSGNTARFEAAGVPVIASDAYKALIATYTVNPPGQTRSPEPTISFAKSYTVKLKGATATAYAEGPGHTGGDSVVYFPHEKVLAAGDDVVAGAPNADFGNGGSLIGLQKVWADLDKLDFDVIIPGHGDAPISRADFEAQRTKLDTLIQRIRDAIKAGTPKSELLAKVQVDDLGWSIKDSRLWNIPSRINALYAELSQ